MFDIDQNILAPMMAAGVFGENVQPLYTPQGGAQFALDGVFDDQYVGLSLEGAEPEFQTMSPVLGVRLAQFPPGVTPNQGDVVTVASVSTTYRVMSVKADGHGWAKLVLMTTS